jgi:hypothetical protein
MLCKYLGRDVSVLVHGFDVYLPGRSRESMANLMENRERGSLAEAKEKGSLDRTAMNNVIIFMVLG